MKKNKAKKTIKTSIGRNDMSFVGKHYVTQYGLIRITHVTQDRVVGLTDKGEEEWVWRAPNGRSATFEIVAENDKFSRALTLKQAYKRLLKRVNELESELALIKHFKPIIEDIKNKVFDGAQYRQ